jgi:hypothetical protein
MLTNVPGAVDPLTHVIPRRRIDAVVFRRAIVTWLVASLVGVGLVALSESTAWAGQSGTSWAYAGAGTQYVTWNVSTRKFRLMVTPGSGMSTDRCMDSMLDWQPSSGHYDSRVIRSCRPGHSNETDPGADGYWIEPSDWDGANVNDTNKGFGYIMDDDFVDGRFEIYDSEHFDNSGTGALYNSPPRTTTDCWARTRTLYEDGHVDVTPNYGKPETQAGTC